LRRRIEQSEDAWTLNAWFEDLELFRRRRIDEITIPDLASSAALILAVDAERMLRRSAETATRPRVRIRVRYDQADKAAPICELILSLLEEREIRIDPIGWTGEPVTIQRF
jgi:hypothetical protein